jgi:hypothetical protein
MPVKPCVFRTATVSSRIGVPRSMAKSRFTRSGLLRVKLNLPHLADVDAVVLDRRVEIETGHRLVDDRQVQRIRLPEAPPEASQRTPATSTAPRTRTNAPTSG